MPSTSPRHGAVYVKELAVDLLERGYKPHQVFERTGISPDIVNQDKPFVPFDTIAAFFEHAATLTGEDTLGFERGACREMRRSGVICYVGMAAPTVLDFIKNVARYRRVFSDAVEVDTDQLESQGILRWYFAVPTQVRRRQYVEFGASGLLYAMRQAANREFSPRLVTFHHLRNNHQDRFRRFFGCDVRFGAVENAYHFRPEDLALPLLTADNDLYSVLTEYCEAILSDKSRNLPPLIVDVERAIADRLAMGEASQDKVARAMGMSSRTLSRRLAGENTTFFKTLEQLRRALAVSYLRDSDLVLAEIAFLLGYSGLSSFNDAFKRWTGQTPGQFRHV
ncbi:AraC family transcriptional regulator [Ruegeria hyattellae]|uniref:AraC family transcriptional regulator n=1 Tax=Ruegeria hyattellae TaxID=3233337 RepID=UPI00355B0C2E